MAGSDEVESFHDPADDFLDPESVQREHSRQVEAIEEKVAEDAADAKEGLLSRLTKRAGQSFKKGFDTVSSLVVTPPEEQEMHHDPSKKYQEEESTPAPEAAAAEAEAAAEEEDGDDPATTDEIRAEFERSADSMNRKQDETRMRIKADAEARKASLKAKLEMAREEAAKKGNAGGAGEVEEEEELAPGGNNDDDDDDANLAAKMANMASVKQSEYDDAMSDALPAVSNRLDYDEAREEWKRAAVTDQEGKYIPVWRSTSADIEMLGTGIGLWFRILKAMSLYFLVMSTPVAIILGNYLYLYYNDNSDLSADTLDLLARFTTGVAATTTQSETVAGWDIRTVMFAVSAMDCFAILVFLMLVAYLKTRQNAYIEENDDAVISLPDYTVPYREVWGIPKDTTEDEVCRHFECFGVVSDCVVVKDIGTVMGTRMKRSKLLSKLVTMKIDAAYYVAKGHHAIGVLQKKRIDKQKERIIKCDEQIQNKLAKGFDSVCAFVTFEEPKCRADAITAYSRGTYLCGCLQSEDLKFRGEHVLKLKAAPESSDVLWENVLRIHPVVRITRKLISLTCIFILLLGAIGIVVFAKDSLAKAPPSVMCSSTVVDPVENPAPNLECAAIWPLLVENANTNTSSLARRSVEMFVANVDHDKCSGFISGNEWAKPMSSYSPFDGAKLANLPGAADPWQGGWIKETQADECAALTCLKCYCTSIVSFANVQDLLKAYVNSRKEGAGNDLCSDIFDQILLEAGVQFGTIAVTAVTNMVLMASAGFFSRFERHETLSGTEANAALYTFLALFVNQALVPVIIYSLVEILQGFPILFQGTFTDFESGWYNKVMVMLIGSAMINAFSFPLARSAPAVVGGLKRTLTGCCAHSQRALNKLHMPPKFELSQRYGQIMCVMFYTMIFFAAAPLLFPLAAFLFFLMYAVDKTLLLKFSRRPPMYDYKLNDLFLSYAPYACWFHLAVATWAFGHHHIPSYIIDPTDAVPGNNGGAAFIASVTSTIQTTQTTNNATDTTTDYSGKPDQFDIMHRLVRANALLPFTFFVALTVSLFLSKILGSAAVVCAAACFQREEKVDDVAPFSTLALPGDARHEDPGTNPDNKLSGLRSYRIEDNPEYMMLFPEVLDAGHG